jgi:hypothetical protein
VPFRCPDSRATIDGMALRRIVLVLAVVAAVPAAAGCGGGDDDDGERRAAPRSEQVPSIPRPPSTPREPTGALAIPRRVPREATGPADPTDERVIRRWLAALRGGDVRAASRYFALPSTFQNGTPVLTIDTDVERVAVNEALPCGAKAIRMGGAGAFTIVVYELVRRPGADCGPGTGNRARGAIRVARGRIREWYRLPDAPGADQPAPPAAGPAV